MIIVKPVLVINADRKLDRRIIEGSIDLPVFPTPIHLHQPKHTVAKAHPMKFRQVINPTSTTTITDR
jgi:hypothetical protein